MAGGLSLFARLKIGYSVTGSVWRGIRFARMKESEGHFQLNVQGKSFFMRRNKTDQQVFIDSFYHRYHRPFYDLGSTPVIIDLGSNIGCTIMDLKMAYPGATIFGAEPDKENYELCKSNIADLDNCSVQQVAIWNNDGFVRYDGIDMQSYAVIRQAEPGQERTVASQTMQRFMKENNISYADYLKMDIEGAEYAVLLSPGENNWLRKIRYLSVEIHNTTALSAAQGMEQVKKELERNNFKVEVSPHHWSSLFATNQSFQAA